MLKNNFHILKLKLSPDFHQVKALQIGKMVWICSDFGLSLPTSTSSALWLVHQSDGGTGLCCPAAIPLFPSKQ